MNLASECSERRIKRINPISDSVGNFIISTNEAGQQITTDDSHIPILTTSKVIDPPWARPTRLGGKEPLNARELIRVLGGMGFWTLDRGIKFRTTLQLMPYGEAHRPLSGTGFVCITANYTWNHRMRALRSKGMGAHSLTHRIPPPEHRMG